MSIGPIMISQDLCIIFCGASFALGIFVGGLVMALCNSNRNAKQRQEINRLKDIIEDQEINFI